jgi:hypothetical protein
VRTRSSEASGWTRSGGLGDDHLFGAEARDTLIGEGGADVLSGGPGNDRISSVDGIEGNDVIDGGPARTRAREIRATWCSTARDTGCRGRAGGVNN